MLLILADGVTLKLMGPDILLTDEAAKIQGGEGTLYKQGKN